MKGMLGFKLQHRRILKPGLIATIFCRIFCRIFLLVKKCWLARKNKTKKHSHCDKAGQEKGKYCVFNLFTGKIVHIYSWIIFILFLFSDFTDQCHIVTRIPWTSSNNDSSKQIGLYKRHYPFLWAFILASTLFVYTWIENWAYRDDMTGVAWNWVDLLIDFLKSFLSLYLFRYCKYERSQKWWFHVNQRWGEGEASEISRER